MRAATAFACAALLGCAGSIPAALELAGGRAGETCDGWVAQEPMCAPELTLFEDRDVARPIAVLTHPGYASIAWTLPDAATDRAVASVVAFGFELSGWARLDERRFPLREAHALGSVLRAPAGLSVRIVGREGAGLRVELPAPFRAPSIVRTTIACDALGAPVTQEPSFTGPLIGARSRLALAAAPHAPIAITVEPFFFGVALLHLVEEREGWAHITGPDSNGETLTVDGWVETSSITRDVERWSDSGCDPADDRDGCPDAIVLRASDLDVGAEPGLSSRLRVREGTEVRIVERRDGHLAIEPPVGGLTPPAGARFWISRDAISACDEAGAECSCP